MDVMEYIGRWNETMRKNAKMKLSALQLSDVLGAYVDVDELIDQLDYKLRISVEMAAPNFLVVLGVLE